MIEWAEQLIELAKEWKLKAKRIRQLLNKKPRWHFTDQRDWGKAHQLEKAATGIEDIAYAMKREAESIPADPVEADLLTWENDARRKIMQRDLSVQELTLHARIFQLTRMVRNARD